MEICSSYGVHAAKVHATVENQIYSDLEECDARVYEEIRN